MSSAAVVIGTLRVNTHTRTKTVDHTSAADNTSKIHTAHFTLHTSKFILLITYFPLHSNLIIIIRLFTQVIHSTTTRGTYDSAI